MRKKSWKQVAAIVICAALLSGCTGENGQEKNTGRKEGQVVNIYCWNDEFKEIYDKYASDLAKKHDVEVNLVIISSDNNAYQINLDEALKEQNTCIDDDKVDLFLIEADYASKYVKSDNSIDVKKTVGLIDEDLKQQYDYTKKIVSENGIQKGVTWQATPGLFAYRRSIAKKVLGTDDPDQVQKQLKDWDKFDQVAQKMNAAGYKMLSGYDIIFFWVIRMIFSGYEHMGRKPFGKVLFHGLVRDDQGRKMSKSLGNGIDPLEVIDKYGADALRYTLITGNAPGNDMRFYWSRVEASRNFANKVWNASRFIMMNDPDNKIKATDERPANLTDADKWILSKMNGLIKEVTDNMEKYELGIAVAKLNDFIWEEFCDWYIEMVKPRLYNDADETKTAAIWTLKTVLIDALKLLHPYMPFITEEIFCNIQDEEESIMISSWPVYDEADNFAAEEKAIETIKEAVRNIRNLRADMNVAPSRKALVYVVTASEDVKNIFNNSLGFFGTLAYASEVKVQADKAGIPEDAVSTVIPDAVIYIPFAELVDIDKEIERLKKEEGRLQGEIKRCNGMLNNERFTSKAPQAKIDEEKAKLVKYTQMLEQVTERLATLSK